MVAPSAAAWIQGLNPEQSAAVSADPDGALLILAGAGSGKTTVLTRRAAYLCDPAFAKAGAGGAAGAGAAGAAGVLALTFTKDAALEMESRLRASGAWERAAQPPWIGTFHAFAFSLLRSDANWARLGFSRAPSLIEEESVAAWIRSGIEAARLAGRAPAAAPDSIAVWLTDVFSEEAKKAEEAEKADGEGGRAAWRARFRAFLLAEGQLGFGDMVTLALRLLRSHPDLLAGCRSRWPRILVDEFQDTSRDQLELVRILAGEPARLFLVGDDDQAIYGFRGADPGNLRAAMEMFPSLSVLKLEANYRSSGPIVAYANSVFRGKPAALRKRLRAASARGRAPVRTLLHADGVEQARWIIAEMERLRKEEGLAWSDMAILYRLNALAPYYRVALEKLAGPEAARETILATVHAAKGLEYPAVFFVGLEDGILPHRRGGSALSRERLEEERRIFYVGVTRAQRFLYLCACRRRMLRGKSVEARPCPFLRRGPSAWPGDLARAWAALRGKAELP
jgi:DNA helicase-2/ATP-dependent DNA helicase PcrA